MTESTSPETPRWAQFWDGVLESRQIRRQAMIDAMRQFIEQVNPVISDRSRRKALIEARLQLAEQRMNARIGFRRALVRGVGQLVASA